MLPHDSIQVMHPWLEGEWQALSFWRTHIRRHMILKCPSLVSFILMTRSRNCPGSPLYTFYFPFATIKESTKRHVETMPWSCSLKTFPEDIVSTDDSWPNQSLLSCLENGDFQCHPSIHIFQSKVKVKLLSHVRLFVTPWTIACRLLRPWDFPGKSRLPFPSPGDLPDPGVKPRPQGPNPGLPPCRQMLYPLSHFSVIANYLRVGQNPQSHSLCIIIIFFLVLPVYCYQPISLHPRAHMLSHVIPWTSARQTPLSMGFSRQEYWSGLPFPSPSLCIIILMDSYFIQGINNLSPSLFILKHRFPQIWPVRAPSNWLLCPFDILHSF